MSAHRTVTLSCPSRVRAEAAKLSGWTSRTESADMLTARRDLCRWHS